MNARIEELFPSGLSRRSFISAALASGAFGFGATSLLASGARAATSAGRDVLTGCHWGAFRAHVADGRLHPQLRGADRARDGRRGYASQGGAGRPFERRDAGLNSLA